MKHAASSFVTTCWSQLHFETISEEKRTETLDYICRNYWYPLFAFARYKGMTIADAEDAVQSFFCDILHYHTLRNATRDKGRFRTYLIGAFRNHLIDLYRRQHTLRRGKEAFHIELDGLDAVEAARIEQEMGDTAEDVYDVVWAQRLLDRAVNEVRDNYVQRDKGEVFEILLPALSKRTQDMDISVLVSKLGMSESAVYQAIIRLRQRWREAVYHQIADTLEQPTQEAINEELSFVIRTISKNK